MFDVVLPYSREAFTEAVQSDFRIGMATAAKAGCQFEVTKSEVIITRCDGGVTARLCRPGSRSGLPCPVPVCCCRGRLARAGSGSHSGVELCQSRTGKGSSGGRKKGVV